MKQTLGASDDTSVWEGDDFDFGIKSSVLKVIVPLSQRTHHCLFFLVDRDGRCRAAEAKAARDPLLPLHWQHPYPVANAQDDSTENGSSAK
jgi:hypothetical protein